ncbi:MAG: hypothetical protein K2X27_22880 [Candidatus Obscuribacterales bacterium]|nr:hypothetical protein [Candidatus Obscuribacterales bacterium]
MAVLQAANNPAEQRRFHDGGMDADSAASNPIDQDASVQPGSMDAGRLDAGTGAAAPANPNLRSGDLARLYESNRDRIDLDHDGFLSSEELDTAILNPAFRGEDAQLVAFLRSAREPMMKMHDDGLLSEHRGISAADIAEYDARQERGRREIPRVTRMHEYGTANFNRLDIDNNGYVSNSELDDALRNPTLSAEHRAALRDLRQRSASIASAEDDEWGRENSGFSRQDLDAYYSHYMSSPDARAVTVADEMLHQSGERLSHSNRDAFANRANPLESIRPEAVRQGSEGDCTLQADLASLAHSNPQAIRDMIHDNGNGTYTVTFPGDPAHPVTVDAPTDSELAAYGGAGEYGSWPAIIERAYGVHERNWGSRVPGEIASHSGDTPDDTRRTMELLTGRPAQDRELSSMSDAELQSVLAASNGRPVTALLNGDTRHSHHPATGLQAGHAYSVVGYDPATRQVTLRNPWGSGEVGGPGHPRDGHDDGQFTMSYEEFRRTFSRMSY